MDMYSLMLEAYEYSMLSTCADKHVGCLLLDANYDVIAKGFNQVLGTASCDSCLSEQKRHKCPAVHAEISALMVLAKKKSNSIVKTAI